MVPVQVGERAWFVEGESAMGSSANRNFISNAGFVVTDTSVVVIDALGSPPLAERLVDVIRGITDKPISHVILTHYHADHVYGLQVFDALGATSIAHREARAYLNSETARQRLEASRKDLWPFVDENTRLVDATRYIDGPTTLEIGGTHFVLEPVGPSHTPEDLAVWVPESRVLFAGDLVFRGRIPFVGNADSRHWIESIDRLLRFDVDTIVPGHGASSHEPRADLTLTRDYLQYLRDAMREAARNLEPFDDAYRATDWSRFSHLPLFDAANRMNAYNTFLLMEQER
ncbi:MAG: MBL fold metallo-hydrolase [Lautropia sp.]